MMFKRLAALALIASLVPAAASGQATKRHIVINQSALSLSAAAVYIAKDAGFFDQEGIDAEFIATGSGIKSIAPLIRGDAQFCACIFSHPVAAQATKAGKMKIFANLLSGYNHKIALRTDVAKRLNVTEQSPLAVRIRALKGLKIGITEVGASTDQVIHAVMSREKMNADKDATLVALGAAANLPPALANKQIDAFTMTPPIPEQSTKAGDAIQLLDLTVDKIGKINDALYMAMTAEESYLKANRDLAVRVTRAIIRAEAYLQTNTAQAKELLKTKEFPQMNQETFDLSFNSLKGLYPKNPALNRAAIDAGIELQRQFSEVPLNVTFGEITDLSILRDAARGRSR